MREPDATVTAHEAEEARIDPHDEIVTGPRTAEALETAHGAEKTDR